MLKVGDKAPDIRVHTDTGEDFRLSELKGKRVVLYFYPKADTPGCTVEACEFRDGMKGIPEKGEGGGVLFLSEGRSAGLHGGSLRVSRWHEGHREEGRGGDRHLAGQAGGAGQVQAEIRSAVHSAGR